jgi:hypothetical membrane protein
MATLTTPASTTRCTPEQAVTRSLLGYGVLAGPLYVGVSVGLGLTRDGFDFGRHGWSLLANGPYGWVQSLNLALTGLFVLAFTVGLARAGIGRWAPRLVGAYGAGLLASGVFRADPAMGFPAGAPETGTFSWHGTLHFVAGGIGFLCLIAGCLVLARRYARAGRRGMAVFSRVTGIAFLAGFAGIASGSAGPTVPAFVAAVVLVWTYLAVLAVDTYRTVTVTA